RRQVVRVGPVALACDHLPPYTYVLGGFDPGGVLDLRRFVEVERDVGSEDSAGIIADDHRAPGRLSRSLQVSLAAVGVGGHPAAEGECGLIEVEVHGAVVD